MKPSFTSDLSTAVELDAANQLAKAPDEFVIPAGTDGRPRVHLLVDG